MRNYSINLNTIVKCLVEHSEPQNNKTMKRTLSTLTAIALLSVVFLFTPNTAEARGHSHGSQVYVSSYSSCGCPVYTKKVFRYHDRYGRPVYSYYRLPISHRCNRYSRNSYASNSSCRSPRYSSCNNRSYRSSSSRGYRSNGVRITYRR